MKKLFVILFVFGSMVTICKANSDNVQYINHVQRTKQFPCANPRLRAIHVQDLLKDRLKPEEQYRPYMTVLARCDEHTGCCPDNQTCAPAESKDVHLTFHITHIDENKPPHFQHITAKNHTRCQCVFE